MTVHRLPPRGPHGPNGHDHDGEIELATCPYCGSVLESPSRLREIEARIKRDDKERLAAMEATLTERFARDQRTMAAKAQVEITKVRREAATAAQAQIKAARASADAKIAERVQAAVGTTEKRLAEAVAAERTRAYEDRMRLDAQLADLQRRLQRKTAGELGDTLEIDLFQQLKDAFPADQIARVPKGAPGADIIHRVVHVAGMGGHSGTCGAIVYDCKNHKRWQNSFVTKLRQDQIEREAEFAVLATNVFPAGSAGHANQLALIDGVIVASPARVVVLAHLLRRQIVQMHLARLGNADRDEKRDALFNFITSDRCTQLLDRIGSLSGDLSDLDAKEETTHRTVWKKRSEIIRTIQGTHGEFLSEVDRIITSTIDVCDKEGA